VSGSLPGVILLLALFTSCSTSISRQSGSITLSCVDEKLELTGVQLSLDGASRYDSQTIESGGKAFLFVDDDDEIVLYPDRCVCRTFDGNIASVILEFPQETLDEARDRLQKIANDFRLDKAEFSAADKIQVSRPRLGKMLTRNFQGKKFGRSYSLSVTVSGTGLRDESVRVRVEVIKIAETR
jgi:hypothetical protein